MRLTLRTLIAWLDDTLTPAEVKAIGHQVSESPFAKELIERIHRVTRQRRLTVPSESGADATDSNTVASYLDNQLHDERVNDFEKRCLTSDVHLAEVASVHQILSMIGHKAKVPVDAKNRMYRLVRGREASTKPNPRPARVAGAVDRSDPPTHPSVRWSAPVRTTPRVIERFGPLAGVLALIGVLGYMASRSLQPEPGRPANEVIQAPKPAAVNPAPVPVAAPPVAPVVATAPVNPAPKAEPTALTPAREEVGSVDPINGVILRSPLDAASWEPIEPKASIKPQVRLINLAPFRNSIKTVSSDVTLVDSAEVVFDPADRDEAARFDLRRGKVVLLGVSAQPLAYNVRFEGHMLSVTPALGRSVGLERVYAADPTTNEPPTARLRVYVPEGTATLKVGDTAETVEGPGQISLQVAGNFTDKTDKPAPSWVADAPQSAFDKEVASQFGQYFRPGRPILSNLVEAMDDPQPKVKELAAAGLGTLGDMESVVTGLDRKDHPAFHRAVVDVLRNGLASGGDSAKAVRDALARQYEEPWPKLTENLIIGLPPTAARDEAALSRLVEDLANGPSRGIRALALDNLRALTGRDSLEYDPDNPTEGKGLRAWQDLNRRKELTRDVPASNR